MTNVARIWRWAQVRVVIALHDAQIAEHGGGSGTRDQGLLESAMARPRHLATYGEPDAADLAAAYAFGIARNHAFVDGNKRTALLAAYMFLQLNGYELDAPEAETVIVVTDVAAGALTETELAAWFRGHISEIAP